ncbi:uncharacterized protein LOC106366427 isoform X2 [Brassica napus]|uniref:uncharacterized protein LOC106366427 isoform X2 n=1 Tax=Brassica napus TaxID=3708 RepID=UPI00207A8935|nr:uncharacterized protein LOC106366427 isoform X2 [Brassica napus]
MSRCYPFPPPGFVPNQVRDESLIEPIKKGTKEEVKREKKDRKHNKDKKDRKRKERDNEAGRSSKHSHKRQRKDESLEKSCLTIELEHQASSQTSCDSTLRSNENEGPNHVKSQPLNGRHNDSETSTRVFLLHDKEQKYPEVMMTNRGQKQCSASSHQESIGPSKLCSKCPPSTAMRFLKLIENWAPETKLADSEDQEWWLLMKVGAKRRHQVSVQRSSKGSSSMVWPTAQFLPEAELHALPFTVPF